MASDRRREYLDLLDDATRVLRALGKFHREFLDTLKDDYSKAACRTRLAGDAGWIARLEQEKRSFLRSQR